MPLLKSINMPAPRWYRITKKAWATGENIFIGIWLLTGHTQDSLPLLIFKLVSSQLKDLLESIMSNGEEYAPAGAKEALLNMVPHADTAKEAVSIALTDGPDKIRSTPPPKPMGDQQN